jgi:hypothetical protein
MGLHFYSVFIFSYSFLNVEGLIAYSLLIYKFYLDDRRQHVFGKKIESLTPIQ